MGSISPSANHSPPLPYLYGGLAATLSHIAFALVIFACSDRDGGDLESDGGNEAKISTETPPEKANYDEKVLVVMAGDQNPTFLATPVSVNGASSSAGNGRSEGKEAAENWERLMEDYESSKMSGVIYSTNSSIQLRIN